MHYSSALVPCPERFAFLSGLGGIFTVFKIILLPDVRNPGHSK